MSIFKMAIVGLGSRGLSVLEQFIALSRDNLALHLQLDLYDPQTPGSGLHLSDKPDYLMLNTMAGQLSAFCTAHPASRLAGPTFLDWCHAHDLRLDARGHVDVSGQGRPIEFADFVPRRLLGRYLQDSYRWLIARCPAQVQVRHHPERVVSATLLEAGAGWQLRTAQEAVRHYDGLFITSGHAESAPVTSQGEHVLIEGLGLTAMDTLAALTEGRGGRFVPDACLAGWRYLPSGREPQIYLCSRSGLPFHARPQGFDPQRTPWPRLFFTAAAIDRLRRQVPGGQLDFVRDVLPLVEAEMRAVFYQATVQCQAPEQLSELQETLQQAQPSNRLFARLAARWGAFEPAQWLTTERWSGQGYAEWFRHWIEQDLLRSRLGTAHSPLTQALEVWRDSRDLLRQVADHKGLSPASTLDFYRTFAGLSNRLVGGPQKERYEDLLALLDAGVVHVLAPTHGVIEANQRIPARTAHNGLTHNRHALLGDLLRQGLIHAAHPYPADGVAVDRNSRAGHRLWVLGPAVEGSTFYNHYVPTPDPHCLAPLQARRAVQDCFSLINQRATYDHATSA